MPKRRWNLDVTALSNLSTPQFYLLSASLSLPSTCRCCSWTEPRSRGQFVGVALGLLAAALLAVSG